MLKTADRLAKCLIEYVKASNYPVGSFKGMLSCVVLAKCLQSGSWENSPLVSKQLPGIDADSSRKLAEKGKNSFQSILEAEPAELEYVRICILSCSIIKNI